MHQYCYEPGQRLVLTPHVMHERTAAAFACGDHHLNPVTVEQADGGLNG
jgi:hypothetical protein